LLQLLVAATFVCFCVSAETKHCKVVEEEEEEEEEEQVEEEKEKEEIWMVI
jgi:hypothetical protein